MLKSLVIASLCVLLVASATAQERPPRALAAASAVAAGSDSGGGGGTGSRGSDAGLLVINTWNWYAPYQTWSYYNGSTQRLYASFNNSGDVIETAANNDQAIQINIATGAYHWLGIYWTSSTTWSSSRLWYY
jgi:hypothetical protein